VDGKTQDTRLSAPHFRRTLCDTLCGAGAGPLFPCLSPYSTVLGVGGGRWTVQGILREGEPHAAWEAQQGARERQESASPLGSGLRSPSRKIWESSVKKGRV
jgi:hypothetical protein